MLTSLRESGCRQHMRAVCRKLGVTRRTEAVLLARRNGIL
jgi:DNA-binding CsgD family transcriptional regulator